jgi:prephenate dehydratase
LKIQTSLSRERLLFFDNKIRKRRKQDMKKTVAYLGPQGSYSYEVAMHIGENCKLVALEPSKFAQAMREKKVWKIVLPIVNAIGWQVQWVLDLLRESGDGYSITGEVIWNIRSYLVGFGQKNQIKTVYSHSQPLDQCREFLSGMPDITTQAVGSTSAAVKLVAEKKDPAIAAIGTQCAAKTYGVPVIANNISDFPDNQTRFIVLGGRKPSPNENNRTTLLFGTPNKPGALLRVLEVFDALSINMGTILSTTSPNRRLGECLFLVDVDGHQKDDDMRVALLKIKNRTEYLKVLGSYHKANGGANAS